MSKRKQGAVIYDDLLLFVDKSRDDRARKMMAKRIAKSTGAKKDPYGDKPSSTYERLYQEMRTADDVREDAMLLEYQEQLKENGRDDEAKEVSKERAKVRKNVQGLTNGETEANEERMRDLRSDRRKLMEQYNLR